MKTKKALLLILPCLFLSSCGTVDRSLDCIDLWRFDNCIIFEKNKVTKPRGGVSYRGGTRIYPLQQNNKVKVYKDYSSVKIKKPSKTWGE